MAEISATYMLARLKKVIDFEMMGIDANRDNLKKLTIEIDFKKDKATVREVRK